MPGNVNISFEDIEGDVLLMSLDSLGVCASSGSACSAGAIEPSQVLLSIGLSKEMAKGALRLTMGSRTTEEEVDYLLEVIPGIIERIRKNRM